MGFQAGGYVPPRPKSSDFHPYNMAVDASRLREEMPDYFTLPMYPNGRIVYKVLGTFKELEMSIELYYI